ncbi:MAG: fructose-6-phosphate aldolase [Chlorobi bacterium]|nr:fructose-6-phosphate aldolase [Chlorobiota bacterium]
MREAKSYKTLYFLKIKGMDKIPDYIQVRDENFTLIAYFRPERPERAINKAGLGQYINEIKEIVETLPYGKVVRVDMDSLQKEL